MPKRYSKGTKEYIKGFHDGIRKYHLVLQMRSLMERKGVTLEQVSEEASIPMEILKEIMDLKPFSFKKATTAHMFSLAVYFDVATSIKFEKTTQTPEDSTVAVPRFEEEKWMVKDENTGKDSESKTSDTVQVQEVQQVPI